MQFFNNLSENSICPFTVGRRNWLYSDFPKGAEASAMVYTIVETTKAYNLYAYKYLMFLSVHMPQPLVTGDKMAALVPWNENAQERCAGSLQSLLLECC